MSEPVRIGIVGGMGPLAGVHLQKLIIEATPAKRDQDHIPVICFTNPKIPDRTESLAKDNGNTYVAEVINSLKLLENAGATHAIIACNTAHARFEDIKSSTDLSVLNIIELVLKSIPKKIKRLGLLATDGTLSSGVYQAASGDQTWILPDDIEQKELMSLIYDTKAGKNIEVESLIRLITSLKDKGAQAIILACTELSLYTKAIPQIAVSIVDPMQILAEHVVSLAHANLEV